MLLLLAVVPATSAQASTPPVVVIVMENHSYGASDPGGAIGTPGYIVGNPDAPYINDTLIPDGTLFSNYYSTTHPSLPAYLDMMVGQHGSCTDDVTCPRDSLAFDNLFHLLGAAGVPFATFAQSMPTDCELTSTGVYSVDHNPETYLTDVDAASGVPYDCPATDVPFPSSWPTTLPAFSLIVPDRCHDMEGSSSTGPCPKRTDALITEGDTWLSQTVPTFLASGADVVVVFDEATGGDKRNGGGHVLALENGPGVAAGVIDDTFYNHFSLLSGLEGQLGVTPLLGGAATATPLPIGSAPANPPVITDVQPASGAPGADVTITGSGFTGAYAVRFNGADATFDLVSDSSITATVPASASSGPITVAVPSATASSPSDFTVLPSADTVDLSIAASDSPDPVVADSTITYSISIHNLGLAPATGVVATDTLPSTTQPVSATASQGSCGVVNYTVTCSLGSLAAGGSATATIQVIPLLPGTIVDSAGVTADQADSDPSNDSTSLSTTVKAASATKYVNVTDDGFSSAALTIARGTTMQWDLFGPSANGVHDTTGLGLFDSGALAPPAYTTFRYIGAGRFSVADALGHVETIAVPMTVAPGKGSTTTSFTVTWSKVTAPAGLVFDVQESPPGGTWHDWAIGQTTSSATFVPDAGAGTYSFRARVHGTSTAASGYSAVAKIQVG